MTRNIKLFAQGLLGQSVFEQLHKLNTDITLYTYAKGASRRKSDSLFLREGYPFRYISERKYDPALIELKPDDIVICADWTKDFFHLNPPSCPVYIVHPSLLPMYRGYGAVSEQFIKGVAIGGVTVTLDSKIIDSGDILFQKQIKIEFTDYPSDYIKKCAESAAYFIKKIQEGLIPQLTGQNEEYAFSTQRHRHKNSLIDLNMNALYVYNTIRAFSHPYAGACIMLNKNKITIFKASCEKWYGECGIPGSIIKDTAYGPEIACGDGSIVLTEAEYIEKTFKHTEISELVKRLLN